MKKKETAEQFVKRMLTGLTAKTLRDYPNSVFYVNKDNKFIVEIKGHTAWCRYEHFWKDLKDEYKLENLKIQSIIESILQNKLNIKNVKPMPAVGLKLHELQYLLLQAGTVQQKPKPIRATPVNRQVVKDLKKEVKKTKQLLKRVKKVKRKIDIDSKRIKKFLSETTGANYQFLSAMMDVRNGINNIITNYKLSKEEVCERFGVSKRKYNDFIHGNYEYDIKTMAVVNALFCEYESKKLGENAPFQTPKLED